MSHAIDILATRSPTSDQVFEIVPVAPAPCFAFPQSGILNHVDVLLADTELRGDLVERHFSKGQIGPR